jgi:hypothetical protein
MRKFTIAAIVLGSLIPGVAAAQQGTVTGAAGGAVTGAIVGGPVGAAVGGVAGAVAGTVLAPPPPEVQSYVVQEEQPSVVIKRKVIVGEALPDDVVLYKVPKYDAYQYGVVNGQRVIVDSRSRRVVQIVR